MHEHILRFGGKASHYHAAAISSSEADSGDCCEEALGGGGSIGKGASPARHRRCGSTDSYDSAFTDSSSHHYPPLSPQAQSVIDASRRRFVLSVAVLLLGAVALYASGYRAGERHEKKKLASALGIADADPIVADKSLLDADDDTVEELTAEQANDLNIDEIMEEAEDEAEEELALEIKQQRDNDGVDDDNLDTPNYQKFLVFAEQRSGSRFLTDLLDDHPQIVCGNEELNHKDTPMNLNQLTKEDYMALLDETYGAVLQSKASSMSNEFVVGYKVMYNQGVTHFGKDLMAELDAVGIKVIHLIRKNKLLQYISFASNEKDKHLMADKAAAEAQLEKGNHLKHQAHPKTKEEAQRIRDELVISGKHPEKILSFMEAREEDDRTVSNLLSAYLDAKNYMFVDYEDLSNDTDMQMGKVFALLGVKQRKVQSQMEKIHEGKLTRDYFKKGQQDAVREALETSKFRWMLDGW